MEKTIGVSAWVLAAQRTFAEAELPLRYQKQCGDYTFSVFSERDSLWIVAEPPARGRVALRAAYCPDGEMNVDEIEKNANGVVFHVSAVVGDFLVNLQLPDSDRPLIRVTTTLTPSAPLLIPYWPRDVIPLDEEGNPLGTQGTIHVKQVGPRSGLLYFCLERPESGSVLYLQNLTALNDYSSKTETSLTDTVGGDWPELGFALPPFLDKALPEGEAVVISDALVLFHPETPKDEFAVARQFLDMLADAYLYLPRPDTAYYDWMQLADSTLKNLEEGSGCWTHAQGESYVNAYISDYDTPPEIMVQLAVLLPMKEYADWLKRDIPLIERIRHGLPAFHDEKIGSIARWLPGMEDQLDGSEDHKNPRVMDSWYLHHPLINLSRLAIAGDKDARKLFLDGVEYASKVAHKFKYKWPVFYNMDTLEVLKAEVKEGEGGELDVGGIYAHVMLQAWQVTKEDRYLEEAKKGALSLKGAGFKLFYQANDTAFASGALLRLWKETGDEQFLNLSYLCLANLFANMWLWECDYGYAKDYPTFFGMFPLKEAPYLAAYEEHEVFAAFHDYLSHAEGENILPSVRLLLPEFVRFLVFRAAYYCPPLLPEDMLEEEPKTGELDKDLWIPIEDLQDGWEKSGQVGQEVYGAGKAFTILSRHYKHVDDEPFVIFIDYPTAGFKQQKEGHGATFTTEGDERLTCRMRIIPTGEEPLPRFTAVGTRDRKKREYKGTETPEGHLEYTLHGGHKMSLTWEASGQGNGKKKTLAKKNGQ